MNRIGAANAPEYGEIEIRDVTKRYGDDSAVTTAVENCSFIVERGKFSVLIGPSGSGKTTLINLMAGYEMPTSGEILVDGEKISGPGWDRLVVFQETALFPWMTTFDNVVYGPLVQRQRAKAEIFQEATRLLELVGLQEFRDKYPIQLSGGMQRRRNWPVRSSTTPKCC